MIGAFIICNKVSDYPIAPIENAIKSGCHYCAMYVWLSPATLAAAPEHAVTVCIPCARRFSSGSGIDIQKPTRGQVREFMDNSPAGTRFPDSVRIVRQILDDQADR